MPAPRVRTIRVELPSQPDVRIIFVSNLSSGSGGNPFLDANVARVDPSGNDSTGIVGDLTKPFLTVQAALDDLLLAGDIHSVILIGNHVYAEDLVWSGVNQDLYFFGLSPTQSTPFQTLSFGDAGSLLHIHNCSIGQITAPGASIELEKVEAAVGIIGAAEIISYSNSAFNVGNIIADSGAGVSVVGLQPASGSIISSPDGSRVIVNHCGRLFSANRFFQNNVFSVDAPNAELIATDSILNDITVDSAIFNDSRAFGSITINSPIVYNDVLLNPALMDFSTLPTSNPLIAGQAWIDTANGFVVKVSQG